MSEALAKSTDMIAGSKWTVETLRDYFVALIAANDKRFTEQNAHLHESIVEARLFHDERFTGQQRALEVAFSSQQRAIDVAFIAQQTGLNAALLAQKDAVNAQLVSSAQAVLKAETAAEGKFNSVNEFRQTLSDQQRSLIPRAEAEVLIKSLAEKLQKVMADQAGCVPRAELRVVTEANAARLQKIEDQAAINSASILNRSIQENSEKRGLQTGWQFALGAFSLIVIAIGLIAFLFHK